MVSAVRLTRLVLPNIKQQMGSHNPHVFRINKISSNWLFLSNSLRIGVLSWAKAYLMSCPFGVTVTRYVGYTHAERVEAILESQSKSDGLNKEEIRKM